MVAHRILSQRNTMIALLAGTMLATPVFAQQAPAADNGEIVVTAQKREESLQKVPISIQALSAKKLEEHQVTSFDDYAKLLPAVSFQSFGPGQSQIYFRGITSGGDGQHNGSQPTSALYLDEVPLTTIAGSVDLHIYDMQRVEALSGPQGTLFGSSSLAGTLRLITNKPSHKFEAGIDVTGTSFGKGSNSSGGTIDAFVNVPLNKAMALRASAFYQHDGGYISNTPFTRHYTVQNAAGALVDFPKSNAAFAKKNFNTVDTYGGRAALGIDLSDSWTVTPAIIYQHQEANGEFLYDPKVGDLQLHDFTPTLNKDEWAQAALTIHGKIGAFDVTYAGGYFNRHVDNTADYSYYTVAYYASGGPVYTSFLSPSGKNLDPTQIFHGHDNYTKQSHELRFSASPSDSFKFTTGAFYQRQTDQIAADYIIPGLATATNATAVSTCGDDIFCTRAYRVDRDYAVFVDGTLDILSNLTLAAGIRGFKSRNTLWGFSGFDSTAQKANCLPTTNAALPCVNFNLPNANQAKSQSGEVHRVNLSWKIDRDRLLYATYSTGYRPGGYNRTPTIDPYKADTITNYEVGFKTAWLNRKLYINAAAYIDEWKGVQYGLTSIGASGVVSTYNAGNARIKGLEGDIAYYMGPLTLSGSATYIDAKLTTGFCSIGANKNPDCVNGTIAAPSGTRLPIQPQFKGNATARYKFNIGGAKAYVQGSVNHQSGTRSYLTTNEANLLGSTSGFTTVDFSLGANMGRWTWEAFLLNAFDQRGILSLNSDCVPTICGGFARSYPTKPQQFGLKLGTKF